MKTVGKLLKMCKPLESRMRVQVLLSAMEHLFSLMIPVLAGYAILQIIGHRKNLSLTAFCIAAVLCCISLPVLRKAGQKYTMEIRSGTEDILRVNMENMADGKRDSHILRLKGFFDEAVSPFCAAVLHAIAALILIGRYNLLTALLALSSYLVLGAVLPMLAASRSRSVREESRDSEENTEEDTDEYEQTELIEGEVSARSKAASELLAVLFSVMLVIAVILLYRQGVLNYEGSLITVLTFMCSFEPLLVLTGAADILMDVLDAAEEISGTQEKTDE